MFRVVNVSKRTVTVGGVRIAPLETYIFNENELSQTTIDRINSLVAIGVLKIYNVEAEEVVAEEPTKKSSKKSK